MSPSRVLISGACACACEARKLSQTNEFVCVASASASAVHFGPRASASARASTENRRKLCQKQTFQPNRTRTRACAGDVGGVSARRSWPRQILQTVFEQQHANNSPPPHAHVNKQHCNNFAMSARSPSPQRQTLRLKLGACPFRACVCVCVGSTTQPTQC